MIFLHLYEGRRTPVESFGQEPFDGPIVGPLKQVEVVFGYQLRLTFPDDHIEVLNLCEDLLPWEGEYYGVWKFERDQTTLHEANYHNARVGAERIKRDFESSLSMSLAEWKNRFRPVKNHLEETDIFFGAFLHPDGEQRDYAMSQPQKNLWTVLTTEDQQIYLVPGKRTGDVVEGYVVTELPLTGAHADIVISDDIEDNL